MIVAAKNPPSPRSIGRTLHERAVAELLAAEAHLARQGVDRHEGVHQARRCLRRTRAILAMAQPRPDSRAEVLDAAIARLCRGLSALRDAHALLEILVRFEQTGAELAAGLPEAIAATAGRRDAAMARVLARDPDLRARRQRIAGFRVQLDQLDWTRTGDGAVARAMARSLRRARKAGRRAREHPQDRQAGHRFRRRLRRFHQQNNVLGELAPDLRVKAHALEAQAKVLGEVQDCLLLLTRCRNRSPFAPPLRRALRQLAQQRLKQIGRDGPSGR